jgi:transposase
LFRQHTKDQSKEIALCDGIVIPLDLSEFGVVEQEWQADGSLNVTVIAKQESASCPRCRRDCHQRHDCRARVKRDRSMRGYPVKLIVLKRRFRCPSCAKPFTEPDQACGFRRRTTQRLREQIGREAAIHPVEEVAQTFGVGHRFATDCLHTLARPTLSKRGLALEEPTALPAPRYLGIDEFAVRKGHRYETILCDLEARQVLEVSPGRKQEDVVPLLQRLKEPERVEAVSMDMSGTFRPAVQSCLPHAQIVVDHFHVIQHVMKAFRKVVSSFAHQKAGQILLHRKQHLFLKAQEHLTAEQEQERTRIASHLPDLEVAWKLKEALRSWYATATWETGEAGLDTWITCVREQGPEPLRKALSAFTNWKQEILAFFRFLPTRISNGFVEGKNNRTKAIMRRAYGYRNRWHLRLRILIGGPL